MSYSRDKFCTRDNVLIQEIESRFKKIISFAQEMMLFSWYNMSFSWDNKFCGRNSLINKVCARDYVVFTILSHLSRDITYLIFMWLSPLLGLYRTNHGNSINNKYLHVHQQNNFVRNLIMLIQLRQPNHGLIWQVLTSNSFL